MEYLGSDDAGQPAQWEQNWRVTVSLMKMGPAPMAGEQADLPSQARRSAA